MKKGFTLIELLAVIVILAIISLIAIPTFTNVVEKAKKGGAEQSAIGYNDAVNKQMAVNLMDANDDNDIEKGIYDAPFDSKYNVKVKGQTPTKGWLEVLKDGIYRYSLVIGEYVVSYDGINTTVIKGIEPNPKPSFATDSWEVIINNVRNGNADIYNLGDTKEVDMGELGKHTIRISNMSTPSECLTEGFSQTACGFVLEFADIIVNHVMNDTNTNVGGWPTSDMREYVNNEIYNSLPNDLKKGIINTKVVSSHGSSKNETNFISTDKLYLLSLTEVYGNEFVNIIDFDTSKDFTKQLDYYKNMKMSSLNYSAAKKDNIDFWWLRSAVSHSNNYYFYIDLSGYWFNINYRNSNNDYGVSPAFRIG